MTDYGFYTKEELHSDLSGEISDTALFKTPDADAYLDLLIDELKRRN